MHQRLSCRCAEEQHFGQAAHSCEVKVCAHWPGRRSGKFQTTALETLMHLVAADMGYILIPELAVRKHDPLDALLKYRHFSDAGVSHSIALVCRAHSTRMQDMEALVGVVRGVVWLGYIHFKQ